MTRIFVLTAVLSTLGSVAMADGPRGGQGIQGLNTSVTTGGTIGGPRGGSYTATDDLWK
ncbi:hypothetical protein HKCCE4037_04415 [Rhodobacterales bacterium HKCCE4037]|nr:hypothetical protein [Rhodobacterales bacterium HKCCE4037]